MPEVKKVLLVDDDTSLTNMLKDYLKGEIRHELYVSLTGEEALKILEDKKPDVVLLDMQLPGIQGTQVLRIIREKYPITKVLVITSYDKQVKETVEKLGVDGFFPKPIVLSDVIERIKEVLKAKDSTIVKPIPLSEIQKREGITPTAKILFIEREFWLPYLLPIGDSDREDNYPLGQYGEFEFRSVYCQKYVLQELELFRPDIVICATEVPLDEPSGKESVSTAGLISKITKSKYAPKAVIVHGTQEGVYVSGITNMVDISSVWFEDKDMYNYSESKNLENAERLNKMIWSICYKHNLVKKV
jgi:CheY-like chemotaxis protein